MGNARGYGIEVVLDIAARMTLETLVSTPPRLAHGRARACRPHRNGRSATLGHANFFCDRIGSAHLLD